MFTVYARNINYIPGMQFWDGEEVELFTIPNQNGDRKPFLTCTVNNELGNAGSMEMSIDPKHKYADIWRHMRTLVRVEYDGDTIFYGRALTIDRDMFRTRKIHCEGVYTFFKDSVFEGTKSGYTITTAEYMERLINAHNECMAEMPEKQIFLGEVPGHYTSAIDDEQKIKNETQKFAASKGYKEVQGWMDELISDYAGHFRIRYTEEGTFTDDIGQYGQGNIDLNDRIVAVNADGMLDTEASFVYAIEDVTPKQYILLPSIINGVRVSEAEGIQNYVENGEYLGIFTTREAANIYAQKLYRRQRWYYTGQNPIPKLYLDWLKTYFHKSTNNLYRQTMSVSSNVVDLSDTVEVNNIFTHVIPVGKNGKYIGGYGEGGGSSGNKHTITVKYTPDLLKDIVGQDKKLVWANSAAAVKGAKIKLSKEVPANWFFMNWKCWSPNDTDQNKVEIAVTEDSFDMPDTNVTVIGAFSNDGTVDIGGLVPGAEPHDVSVRVSPTGSGTASASLTTDVYESTLVKLYKKPASGYTFTGWSVLYGDVTINEQESSFMMGKNDVIVYATFSGSPSPPPDKHSITVETSPGNAGTATPSRAIAAQGVVIRLRQMPNEGFTFSGWVVVSGEVTISNNQFTMGNQDVSIRAVYNAN